MKKRNTILALCLIVLAIPALAFLSQKGQSTNNAQPSTNITNDIPLTQDTATLEGVVNATAIPTVSSDSLDGQVSPLPLLLPSSSIHGTAKQNPAPSAPPGFSIVTVPSGSSFLHIQKSISGTPGTNPNPCLCAPPDMGVAASSKYVVQMVNLAGTIYRTDGSVAKATFSLSDFWFLPVRGGPLGIGMSDPQVLYDARAGRWFASILDTFDVNRIRFAVSATNDPTGVWFIYSVRAGTTNAAGQTVSSSQVLPDQPFIGYSDDKFLIAANDFVFDPTFKASAYFGAQYWILNLGEILAANRFIDATTNLASPSDFRIAPAPTLTPTSTAYMVENCLTITPAVLDNDCPATLTTTDGGITVFTVTGTPTAATSATVTTTTVPIQQTGFPNSADQPGNPASLATNDNSVLSVVWENNLLWLALNDGNNGGPCPTPSCVRLDEIATPVTALSTALQDFDFVTPGGSTFYGAASMDSKNNLVVIYATSSLTVYPTLQVTGRLATAPVETLTPSGTLAAGTAADLSTRYGDYFYAATEPNVPSTFWVSGEFRQNSVFQAWSTQIGEVQFNPN